MAFPCWNWNFSKKKKKEIGKNLNDNECVILFVIWTRIRREYNDDNWWVKNCFPRAIFPSLPISPTRKQAASFRCIEPDGSPWWKQSFQLLRYRRSVSGQKERRGWGKGEKNEVDDQQPRRWPQEEQRCAVAFT